MRRKFAGIVVAFAIVLSLTALAQTGNAAAAPATPAATASAPAATTPASTRVGIINIQQAIIASNEGQRDFQALEKKFEPRQAELKKMNDEIEELKKQLQTQGDKLNDDARLGLQRNIEGKQKNLQRSVEDAQKDAQDQQGELFNRIGQKMMGVLDKYAKANGYSLIIDVSSPQTPVLWADPASTDVTKAIVDAYNAQSGVAAPATTAKPAKPPATVTPAVRKPATPPPTTPKQPQ
jgi:outer membrane protein